MFQTHYEPDSKIWSGGHAVSRYNPNVSIGQLMLQSLMENPEQIAQISDNNGLTITSGEMYMKSIRVAQNLIKMGFKQGDVIGTVAFNHHDLAPIVIACLTLGLPVNALDPTFTEDEIYNLFKETKPKVIFCHNQNLEIIKCVANKLITSVKIYAFDTEPIKDLFQTTGNELNFIPPDIGDGTKLAAGYICTSGTSGLPKCFGLSHTKLITEFQRNLSFKDVTLCFSTLYWLSGWMYLLNGCLSGCTRIITTEPFNPQLMLCMFSKYKVTATFMPPPNIATLLKTDEINKTDLTSLKQIMCGGSMISGKKLDQFHKYAPNAHFFIGYGMSEAGPVSFSIYNSFVKPNSIGKLTNDVKVKIIDENGQRLGIMEDGEICVWKNLKFLGYVGNDAATNEILDSDGWIHTGDIGHFDADGYLYVVDRKKDIIKYKNHQISPSEIEDVIHINLNVNNVCVVGVLDEDTGTDLPTAFIIQNKDTSEKVTANEVKRIVKEKLSDAKQLRGGVYFLDEFPLTASGKILKRELRKLASKLYLERK